MKKLFLLIFFFSIVYSSYAQNKSVDSLKTLLTNTSKPIERFSIIIKILETNIALHIGTVDSASCIRLHQIAQQLNNDSLLAISYNWIGFYFSINKGDNATALEYYFKAIPLAEKVKDKRRLSSLYFDIAMSYFNLQNIEEAVKNTRKGGENLPNKSSPVYDYMLVQYQSNMSEYYILANQPDSALHYAQALTETNRRLKSILFEYGALYLNGAAYVQIGDKEMAEIYFKKANAISGPIDFNLLTLRSKNNYMNFMLDNNRIPEARELAMQLFQLGKRINNNDMKLAAAGSLRRVFDVLHQTDSAYYYSRTEADINALIFSQNNINKVQALAFNEQLRMMENTAKKTAEAEQRKQNLQYAFIALGIITFIFLFLLLSRSFITNTKLIEFLGVMALLIVFEFLNLLMHPFLERVTNHAPLLMLMALVCIAAILVPLHYKVEKWSTAKLVEKNKKIRLANAKKTIEKLEGKASDI